MTTDLAKEWDKGARLVIEGEPREPWIYVEFPWVDTSPKMERRLLRGVQVVRYEHDWQKRGTRVTLELIGDFHLNIVGGDGVSR